MKGKSDKSFIVPLIIVPLLFAGMCFYLATDDMEIPIVEGENVVINEVCKKNNSIFIDANSEGCDYVELYNPTTRPVDISGWYFSDDHDALAKVQLRGTVLEPGDFYIIYLGGSLKFTTEEFFSGPVRDKTQGEACGFSLSSIKDDELFLCDGSLEIVDSVSVPSVGEDLSYLRTVDGGSVWGIRTASPLQSNNGASPCLPEIPEPETPEFDGRRYVVSLSVLEEDLYDYETGIYTEGIVWDRFDEKGISDTGHTETDKALHSNWKQGWKRRARIKIFNEDEELLEDTDVHISCHGNTSISDSSKSLNVYVDNGEVHLFDDNEGQTSFLLRNGGSERFQTKLRDPVLQAASKGLNVAVQDFICCDVYLNGEYLGPYSIMEKYSADYLAKHYDVDPDRVAIIKNPTTNSGYSVVEGSITDMTDFVALYDYVKVHNMADDECYRYVASRMDIDSYIDYLAIETYIGNVDVYPNNNIYIWRANTDDDNPYGDGRWRFMLQDLDASSGADISYVDYEPWPYQLHVPIEASLDTTMVNIVAWEGEGNESNLITDPLFIGLIENEGFKEAFVERLHYVADNNFEAERVADIMNTAYHQTNPGWVRISKQPKSRLKEHIADFNRFFENRSDYIFDYVAEHLETKEQDF